MANTLANEVGLICRWSLLAVIGAFVVAVGWSLLAGFESIPPRRDSQFCFPDVIVDPRRPKTYVGGVMLPRPRIKRAGLVRLPDGQVRQVRTYKEKGYLLLGQVAQQPRAFQLVGLPYTQHAFRRTRLQCTPLSRQRRLVLVDAQAILADMEAWNGLLADRPARPFVAALSVGSLDELAPMKKRLNQRWPELPVLFVQWPDGGWLMRYRDVINAAERPNFARTTLVTNSQDRANDWAAKKWNVVLIAPDGPAPGAGKVKTVRSVRQWVESLETP